MIRDAKELIEKSSSVVRSRGWIDELTDDEREYVMEVIVLASERNGVNVSSLARNLVRELGVKRSVITVRATLVELIDGAKKA
jgi:hypothetical protein